MANHTHETLTDVVGQRVEFTMELHALIARCIKALRADDGAPMEGTVWEPSEQTGRVMIVSAEAFIEACAYAITNPIEAGARSLSDWPGFVSNAKDMVQSRAITLRRPDCLPDRYPEVATLRFCMPPMLRGREREIQEAIDRRVDELTRDARREVLERGGRFKTREELMSMSPFDSPSTPRKKKSIKPALRAANSAVMRAAKKALRDWRHAYRVAFEAFRDGNHRVEWPAGTWFYAKYAAARVAETHALALFGAG
jgi:hypothetical protein